MGKTLKELFQTQKLSSDGQTAEQKYAPQNVKITNELKTDLWYMKPSFWAASKLRTFTSKQLTDIAPAKSENWIEEEAIGLRSLYKLSEPILYSSITRNGIYNSTIKIETGKSPQTKYIEDRRDGKEDSISLLKSVVAGITGDTIPNTPSKLIYDKTIKGNDGWSLLPKEESSKSKLTSALGLGFGVGGKMPGVDVYSKDNVYNTESTKTWVNENGIAFPILQLTSDYNYYNYFANTTDKSIANNSTINDESSYRGLYSKLNDYTKEPLKDNVNTITPFNLTGIIGKYSIIPITSHIPLSTDTDKNNTYIKALTNITYKGDNKQKYVKFGKIKGDRGYNIDKILSSADSSGDELNGIDIVDLKFRGNGVTLHFVSAITGLSETVSPSWNTETFTGNPFNYYTYDKIERSVSFNFKVYSTNFENHKAMWARINALSKLTYPQGFKNGSVIPPFVYFTLGNMYKDKLCFIESLTNSVDDSTPWENGYDFENDSIKTTSNGYVLPQIVDIQISLKFVESANIMNTNLYAYGVQTTQSATNQKVAKSQKATSKK